MAKKKVPVPGQAPEYEAPDRPVTRGRGHALFLDDIARRAPAVLEALGGSPFEEYTRQPRTRLARETAPDVAHVRAYLAEYDTVALCAWARRWNLVKAGQPADWVLYTALATLARWQEEETALYLLARVTGANRPLWTPALKWYPYRTPIERIISPSPPVWRFTRETEAHADARWRAYKKAVRATATQAGLVPVQADVRPEHIEWLVSFQVLGQEQIAIHRAVNSLPDNDRTPPDKVAKAIRRAASFIGITPRKGRSGRP